MVTLLPRPDMVAGFVNNWIQEEPRFRVKAGRDPWFDIGGGKASRCVNTASLLDGIHGNELENTHNMQRSILPSSLTLPQPAAVPVVYTEPNSIFNKHHRRGVFIAVSTVIKCAEGKTGNCTFSVNISQYLQRPITLGYVTEKLLEKENVLRAQ